MLATDGVLKYASAERICATVRNSELSVDACCAALVDLVRLPNGKLQDDAGVVLIRGAAGGWLGRHTPPS